MGACGDNRQPANTERSCSQSFLGGPAQLTAIDRQAVYHLVVILYRRRPGCIAVKSKRQQLSKHNNNGKISLYMYLKMSLRIITNFQLDGEKISKKFPYNKFVKK